MAGIALSACGKAEAPTAPSASRTARLAPADAPAAAEVLTSTLDEPLLASGRMAESAPVQRIGCPGEFAEAPVARLRLASPTRARATLHHDPAGTLGLAIVGGGSTACLDATVGEPLTARSIDLGAGSFEVFVGRVAPPLDISWQLRIARAEAPTPVACSADNTVAVGPEPIERQVAVGGGLRCAAEFGIENCPGRYRPDAALCLRSEAPSWFVAEAVRDEPDPAFMFERPGQAPLWNDDGPRAPRSIVVGELGADGGALRVGTFAMDGSGEVGVTLQAATAWPDDGCAVVSRRPVARRVAFAAERPCEGSGATSCRGFWPKEPTTCFDLPAKAWVSVATMHATGDTVVGVRGEQAWRNSDDGGGFPDADAVAELPAGRYRVFVGAAFEGLAGEATLLARVVDAPPPPKR